MYFERRSLRLVALLAVGGLVVVACSGTTESGAVEDATTTVAPEVVSPVSEAPAVTEVAPVSTEAPGATEAPVPETTMVPPITAAPATTVAPTPETTEAPAVPTLMQNGIGSFAFGSGTVEGVDAYLVPFLGGATSVVTSTYPEVYEGYYENEAEETGFRYPFGRSACYANELCTYFGGVDPAALSFVGYRQAGGVGSLATASGVAAGSTGAEFPGVIVVEPGGCYSTGGGTADGVRLFLQSSGALFLDIDTAGTWTPQAPPVGEVAVLSLFGGDEPYFTFDDC